MKRKNIDYSLYLVTDRGLLAGKNLAETVEQAILGGVTLVQIREKACSTLTFYQEALKVREITLKYNIPLIVNDRLDIALAVDADGLHIGQADLPLTIARKILGPDKIIGVSAANLAEALTAEAAGADYLGVGAVFPTTTKDDADSVGLAELKRIKGAVTIPVVAIGGIQSENIEKVKVSGADGVAVVSAIIAAADPCCAAKRLAEAFR